VFLTNNVPIAAPLLMNRKMYLAPSFYTHCYLVASAWQCPVEWYNKSLAGDVAELADAHDLESCAARRVGSSPSIPTLKNHGVAPATLFFANCQLRNGQLPIVNEF
jgi:hypothetical protein